MLSIGVDARELLGDFTGAGRYLAELLRRWTVRPDAGSRRFVLYAPERIPLPLPPSAVEHRITGRGRGTWWEQTALRRAAGRDPLDLFFAPAYTAPLGLRVPVAVTIHDVSFLAHPEWFRPRERWRRRWLTSRAASSASVIFTDSQFSCREIELRVGVPRSRIRVVRPGVTPRHLQAPSPVRRERLVLFVGSVFNRRRLPHLLAAFGRATSDMPDARLVIVGDNRTWPRQDLAATAAALDLSSRVELLNYVEEVHLASLYSRAAVFAFLSEYEGFGLTPLEALAAGVPIVVLDTEVAREVYGAAAVYVAAGDIAGTARVLRSRLEHPNATSGSMAEASAVLARYSWDRAAEETLIELERAGRR